MPSEDKPYRLPPPIVVADTCAASCWRDEVDDESRLLLEMAADTIRALTKRNNGLGYEIKMLEEIIEKLKERCVRLAQALEQAECGK